ncbi:MAG: HPF/RaiA family ribosome-associated protein [Gammaproteobacteria bacterium]|nr:HPF/RaiA family ribosome-associated protein [Gammaproteobacteria bacterium]NIR83559.1 HPF/RaiA family ribosome-associated protein [Gammaproteobacteria bacterium]NIR91481.1 HPF/RaiA family ribosome-associated protein [Gammaproteobacteria bacterium]NIU04721.1 HPF/RaiA family ribosome-associated protein [Gammaproteobacteria bacterium]NIV51763.1 cold shock domain-containing protein [Gammaproteobacteria bacterium]
MRLPLEITFRNMQQSPAIESRIREKASKLEEFCEDIMGCRVAVEAPHRNHNKGNLYHIRIDLTVPDGELVVSRGPGQQHAHEDVYVAIRDAFNAAKRQVQDYMRRRRGHVKRHDAPPHGRIVQLYPEEGYGKIETPDGRLVYFHRNSVLNGDFDKLEVGVEVRFAEEKGDEGPQASTVKIVGKHHIIG